MTPDLPAKRQPPLLMVDVDGVISLFNFRDGTRPPGRFINVEGIVHYVSAAAGGQLAALGEEFELVWCTGWQERANEHLVGELALKGRLPHLTFGLPPGEAPRHWKLDAIEAHADAGRPLAWIDDDHRECDAWARERPGPTLLVTTDPAEGITDDHVSELLTWARSLRRQ